MFLQLAFFDLPDLRWRDPDLEEVIEYLSHDNEAIRANAAGKTYAIVVIHANAAGKTYAIEAVRANAAGKT